MTDMQVLNALQVAELLGISVATLAVWRCTQRYSLPYVKVGRSVRYLARDIYAFIEARTLNSNV